MNTSKKFVISLLLLSITTLFGGCKDSTLDSSYQLIKSDITLSKSTIDVVQYEILNIVVTSVSDEGVSYEWSVDDEVISTSKNLVHTFTSAGSFTLILTATQGTLSYEYTVQVEVSTAPYQLEEDDVVLQASATSVAVGDTLLIEVTTVVEEDIAYCWYKGTGVISQEKNLKYISETIGEQIFKLVVTQGSISYDYYKTVDFIFPTVEDPDRSSSPYISKVLDYLPAVGQYVGSIPVYVDGDTQESMNQKVLESIGGKDDGLVTLGGYGGYVVVGFDHTIVNKEGLCDFRVYGNAFNSETETNSGAKGGSSEPAIIMVAYDLNQNGEPDADEWYEIAGSSHRDVTSEPWLTYAEQSGLDVNFYSNYSITYTRESKESTTFTWSDNKGESGELAAVGMYAQPKFPEWIDSNEITFSGSRLPQNGINEPVDGSTASNYVLYCFNYGYADNAMNSEDASAIDISWAVDSNGNAVNLPGVDFIKIYTGVNQFNGLLGDCSSDIAGVGDLHLLGEEIDSTQF